jgi:hypothetical protein
MKKRYILLAILILIPLLAVSGFVIWGQTPPPPMPEALAALQSDSAVTVETSPWLTFSPTDETPTTGFIFYPGGRVDERSYAPFARAIAEQGYLVVIVPVPLHLAFFGLEEAGDVIDAHPEIEHWVVGGHSLGGVAATQYAEKHPDAVDGVALWASYPSGDISALPLKIASISASNDGLSTPEKIEASRANLPPDTTFVVIPGGNHAGFGWYGPQNGDNSASISRAEQQAQTVAATVQLLQDVSAP